MDSYRPAPRNNPRRGRQDDGRRNGQAPDHWRPGANRDDSRRKGRAGRERKAEGLSPNRSAVTKPQRARETNPSTRIHSLRNLLTRDLSMPMTLRQEKERELAALLLEQQKSLMVQANRKNLQRYHFVRFMERQKAERTLKRLVKTQQSAESLDEESKRKLEASIHTAEVDLNYTKYAPLGDKYISIFVDERKEKRDQGKAKMNKRSFALLSEDQRAELDHFSDNLSNIVRSSTGTKPPVWYEVEKCMAEGQAKLDALREGKLSVGNNSDKELTAVGGKNDAALRQLNTQQSEPSRPSWLDDDGMIDPADLDSDDDHDEEMSDGGFFER